MGASTTPDKNSFSDTESYWHELFCEAQKGNDECYKIFLSELKEFLSKYCKKLNAPWNSVDDCVQECLMAVHLSRHTFDPSRPLMPWLRTVVRHKVIDQIRKTCRRSDNEILAPSEVLEASGHDSSKEAEAKILLEQMLDQLQSEFSEAIRLTKITGYTEQEAADELGVSKATVKIRIHRGVKALKELAQQQIRDLQKDLLYPFKDF